MNMNTQSDSGVGLVPRSAREKRNRPRFFSTSSHSGARDNTKLGSTSKRRNDKGKSTVKDTSPVQLETESNINTATKVKGLVKNQGEQQQQQPQQSSNLIKVLSRNMRRMPHLSVRRQRKGSTATENEPTPPATRPRGLSSLIFGESKSSNSPSNLSRSGKKAEKNATGIESQRPNTMNMKGFFSATLSRRKGGKNKTKKPIQKMMTLKEFSLSNMEVIEDSHHPENMPLYFDECTMESQRAGFLATHRETEARSFFNKKYDSSGQIRVTEVKNILPGQGQHLPHQSEDNNKYSLFENHEDDNQHQRFKTQPEKKNSEFSFGDDFYIAVDQAAVSEPPKTRRAKKKKTFKESSAYKLANDVDLGIHESEESLEIVYGEVQSIDEQEEEDQLFANGLILAESTFSLKRNSSEDKSDDDKDDIREFLTSAELKNLPPPSPPLPMAAAAAENPLL